ncbi:hypothetical protein HNQ79_006454 [Streptomyces candidus]|uniref:Uncharacterized protein n=1 Tax=Streptomyces candidus TaxID=67283 RepID=A0A7X0HLN0_9ACTN|nr:hypothetical protein [Streptomyces candidus]
MASHQALNPPTNVDHMLNGHGNMIVGDAR